MKYSLSKTIIFKNLKNSNFITAVYAYNFSCRRKIVMFTYCFFTIYTERKLSVILTETVELFIICNYFKINICVLMQVMLYILS